MFGLAKSSSERPMTLVLFGSSDQTTFNNTRRKYNVSELDPLEAHQMFHDHGEEGGQEESQTVDPVDPPMEMDAGNELHDGIPLPSQVFQ